MAQESGANCPTYANDFTCRYCGQVCAIHYDWQRCYECFEQAGTKDLRTLPGVCLPCCRKNHHKPISTK